MKIKRILAFLAGMLIAISAVGVTNQPEQVSASVFKRPQCLRSSAALGMAAGVTERFSPSRLRVLKLI